MRIFKYLLYIIIVYWALNYDVVEFTRVVFFNYFLPFFGVEKYIIYL